MFPLIGLLFLIGAAGAFVGLVAFVFKATRRLAPFLIFPPLFAAFLSFWLLWGGGFLVEWLFGPTRWSSLGAFVGLVGGFVLGGFCGLLLAWRVSRRFSA